MKKRLSAFFLALALCLGLAIPAFAADEGPAANVSLRGAENSGTIYQSQTMDINIINFARSGSDNAHITYGVYALDGKDRSVAFVPKGVDIVVKGVESADKIVLRTFSAIELEEGPFKEGQFKDLSGGTYLFCRLLTWQSEEDVSLVPLDIDDPMKFEYDDPNDGQTHVAGAITAADAGFQADEAGDIVLNSEWLYDLLDEGDLIQIVVGNTAWMCRLSGDPLLVSDVFTDVETGNWVSDPVAWALMKDITTGTSEGRFSPGRDCTQAQILTFLYRAAREEQVESSAEDMELAVQWAREKGMIDDSFDGSTPCTRAAAVNYIWQAFDKPDAEVSSFVDVDENADYAGAVSWAVEKGVTNGTNTEGTMFSPDTVCTRGHIATFLYRAYNN